MTAFYKTRPNNRLYQMYGSFFCPVLNIIKKSLAHYFKDHTRWQQRSYWIHVNSLSLVFLEKSVENVYVNYVKYTLSISIQNWIYLKAYNKSLAAIMTFLHRESRLTDLQASRMFWRGLGHGVHKWADKA